VQEWNAFLQKLEKDLGETTVKKWLFPLRVSGFDARNLYLEAEDPLQRSWFEEHIRPRLKFEFLNNNGRAFQVHVNVSTSPTKKSEQNKEETKNTFILFEDKLDPELTFENFLNSEKNTLAYKILSYLSNVAFNPIYIYGPKHAGKTHLLHACTHTIQYDTIHTHTTIHTHRQT